MTGNSDTADNVVELLPDASHDDCSRKFAWTMKSVDKYYDYLRDEISREDGIAHTRIASLLTFQGFLISAAGLLLTGAWLTSGDLCFARNIALLRECLIGFIGIVGFSMALVMNRGIQASFNALETAKDEWETVLGQAELTLKQNLVVPDLQTQGRRQYRKFPRAYGPRGTLGARFGMSIPLAFAAIWLVYLTLCAVLMPYPTNLMVQDGKPVICQTRFGLRI